MTSPDGPRRKLAQLKDAEAKLRKDEARYTDAAAKKRSEAGRRRSSASRTSSASTAQRYLREAAKLEGDAAAEDKKAADIAKKVGANLTSQATEQRRLSSAETSLRRHEDREDARRRDREKAHAREVARLARPTVRHVHEVRHIPPPKPEELRVAYLTANPRVTETDPRTQQLKEIRIRVDNELRQVREEVKRALFRDSITIEHWPAATPIDILNVLNDQMPHILHFSGHGGAGLLEFDDGLVTDPHGTQVSLDHLAKALGAIEQPPQIVILNACDTLDGAEVLLESVPVVAATTRSITDLAATVFASRFYAAIAAGRSVRHALDQAKVAIDMLAGGAGDVIESLARDDVDLTELVLVRPPTNDISDS